MAKKGLYHNINKRRKEGKAPLKPSSENYPTDKAFEDSAKTAKEEYTAEGKMETARKNVGADDCWVGYKAKGTKKKDGKLVPNCVKEGKTFQQFCAEAAERLEEQPGDGYMGPRRLGIKNPMASDATRAKTDAAAKAAAKKNLQSGGKPKGGLINRLQSRADMIDAIGEEYKDLPKRKMGMKAGKKVISALGHAAKAGAEEQGTIEAQVRTQKAEKKGKQATKMHDTASKHDETLSRMKSLKNKLKGVTKREKK